MKRLAILTLTLLFAGTLLRGEWQLITDFDGEGGLDNNIVGTRIWSPDDEVPGFVGQEDDPAPWTGDGGNKALHVDHNNTATQGMETAYILMPEDILDGSTATLYFRWWMDKNGGHETAISLTDTYNEEPYNTGETPNDTITNGYGDHKTWWRLGGEFSIENFGYSTPNNEFYWPEEDLGAQENGWSFLGAISENQAYQPGVWMEMWIVFDMENDRKYEYQVQNDGVQKQNMWEIRDSDGVRQSVIDNLPNHLGPTDMDLTGIYMVNWSRPQPNYDTQVYADDFWIDYDGINLTTPPHGKTRSTVEVDTTPLAVAAGAGATTITLTNPPPAEGVVGALVSLSDATPLGIIASIAGNVLTLEGATAVAIPANDPVTFSDGDDPTPRVEAADVGATTVTMTAAPPAEAEVGKSASVTGGGIIGNIASIDGNVLTLELPLAVAVAANAPVSFGDADTEIRVEAADAGSTTVTVRGTLPAEAQVGQVVTYASPRWPWPQVVLGRIASIDGNVLTFEAATETGIAGNTVVGFADPPPLAAAGDSSITLSDTPPAEAVVGALVQLADGTIVGAIASIDGNVLTLETPLNSDIHIDEVLAFVEGAWVLITDFDGEAGLDNNVVGGRVWAPDDEVPGFVGQEDDPAPWTGDEGNKALHVDHNNTATQGMETAYILMPEDIIDGDTATLYFRWWMDKNGGHETAISLTDTFNEPPYNVGETPNDTITNGYGDHKTWWRLGGEFSIENFGYSTPNNEFYWPEEDLGPQENGWSYLGAIPEQQAYQPGVWLEMWIVFDTENDRKFEYQIQNDGIQKQNMWEIRDADGVRQSVIDNLPNHLGPTDMDLTGIYMVNWARPQPNYDTQVYADDFWIFYGGKNLSTPNHGKTRSTVEVDTTPLAVAAGAGATAITLTNPPPAEGVVGALVSLSDATPLGIIASISGNVLTLEGATAVAIPANDPVTFSDGDDPTPRVEAADVGATTVTMTAAPPAEAEVGKSASVTGGGIIGNIASIDGNVLTLELPLAVGVVANSPVTFGDADTEIRVEAADAGSTTVTIRGALPAEAEVGKLVTFKSPRWPWPDVTLGKIASIDGSVLTLEAATETAIAGNTIVAFADPPPVAEAADVGATTITVADLPDSVVAGQIVSLDDGTELGNVASVDGNVITLEAALTVAVPADSVLVFTTPVDTTPRAEETAPGSTTITMTAESVAAAEVGQLVFLDDGTELGKIASIEGQVITFETPVAYTIAAGAALTFVDDNSAGADGTRGKMVNLSTRSQVGTGDDVLIGGFVIGTDSQQVLIQATGPELTNSGVAGALADPFLTVTNTSDAQNPVVVATNDNWQDTQGQDISDLWGGSPPLADGSLSSGVLITLDAGTYTATISGVGDTTGVALIEVYEID